MTSSWSTLLVAFGLTVALVGLALGQALLWPGVGLTVLGVVGVLGERAR